MNKIHTIDGQIGIEKLPSTCPFCHKAITPNPLYGHIRYEDFAEVLMHCPAEDCKASFIAYYVKEGTYFYYADKVSVGNLKGRDFNQTILDLSPMFGEIYNQAYFAEQQGLTEICGVGYRKALEFLIKDYAISKFSEQEENIKKKMLSPCINDYIEDSRIKSVTKRATWLGNDETHYVRKWEGKDLCDLKRLIDLTLHWVEMEKLTECFVEEMPD